MLRPCISGAEQSPEKERGQLTHLTGARSLLSLWILADHFAHRVGISCLSCV